MGDAGGNAEMRKKKMCTENDVRQAVPPRGRADLEHKSDVESAPRQKGRMVAQPLSSCDRQSNCFLGGGPLNEAQHAGRGWYFVAADRQSRSQKQKDV